jgi:hypothetical protein
MNAGKKTVTLPISGVDYEWWILGPSAWDDMVNWANAEFTRNIRESMEGEPITKIAKMIRECGKPYSMEDLDKILDNGDSILHMLYLSFSRANPSVSKRDWRDLLSDEDIVYLCENLGEINPKLKVSVTAQSNDSPPQETEAA